MPVAVASDVRLRAAAFGGRDALAVGAFFLSGFVALVYEICWIRKASVAFGAATPALSTVLAVFFGGMALGSYLFGRYGQRAARPLVVYAWIEILLGVFGIASPLLFAVGDAVFGWAYPAVAERPGMLNAARAAVVMGLLIAPATLMGGTLPLFCRHYVTRRERIATSVGLLYGCNTLGAAAGCAAAGFVLIPRIGINASLYIGGAVNIAIGILMWLIFRRIRAALPPTHDASITMTAPQPQRAKAGDERASAAVAAPARLDLWVISALFFGSGLIILASEVLWARFLSLLVRNTVYTYTLTLTVILAGIVAGSVLTSWLFDRTRRRALVFGAVQVLIGLVVLGVLTRPPVWWDALLEGAGAAGQLRVFLMVLLPPAVLAGISFPLAIRMAVHSPRVSAIGVGRMTALNTVGGIVGALGAGFVILPMLGLHAGIVLTTGMSVALGVMTWLILERSMQMRTRAALATLGAVAWLVAAVLHDVRLPADFLAARERLVAYREGIGSNMAIVRRDPFVALEIDRLWQGENRRGHQAMAAHVPALLHGQPRQVLVIGTGTGQTAAAFLTHDIERLDCVDIEPQLMPLVREYFESDWMDDPRVRFIVEDGRSFTTHTDRRYDLISIEVGQVFRPGVASFYTLDFYRRARERLNDGGLLCQFVPVSFFDAGEFRMIVRTFREAFPESVLWYNTGELLLIGSKDAPIELNSAMLRRIEQDPTWRQELRFAYWGGPAQWLNRPDALLASFLCGPGGIERLASGAPVYRDDRPHLEYTTSRHRATSEIEIVRMIEAALEPIATITDETDSATLAAADVMRRQNLRDIVADAFKRPVEQLRAAGRSAEAIEHLRRGLACNADNVELNLLLANELIPLGQLDAALPHLRAVLRIDPDNARAHYGAGHALHRLGRIDEAIEHYTHAARLDPHDAPTHSGLGAALAARAQFEQAQVHFRQAVTLAPDNPEMHNNLANVLVALGRPDEAVESYRTALRLRADFADAHQNMGVALMRLRRADEAIEHFRAAVALRPNSAADLLRLGDALRVAARLDEAAEQYRHILALDPNHADARARLADVLEQSRKRAAQP